MQFSVPLAKGILPQVQAKKTLCQVNNSERTIR